MTIEFTAAAQFSITSEHPALAGHFPGMPVAPGAVLLDRVCEAATLKLNCPTIALRLDNVKFMHTVRPGMQLTIAFAQSVTGLQFKCLDDENRVYVSGSINNDD